MNSIIGKILSEKTLSLQERCLCVWFLINGEVRLDQVAIAEQTNIGLRTLKSLLKRLREMNILKSRSESYGQRCYMIEKDITQWRLMRRN